MRYLIRILKIIWWGIMLISVPIIWLMANVVIILWYFSFKHCINLFEEGWLDNIYYETEDYVFEKDGDDCPMGVFKYYYYKNPIELFLDKRNYYKK